MSNQNNNRGVGSALLSFFAPALVVLPFFYPQVFLPIILIGVLIWIMAC